MKRSNSEPIDDNVIVSKAPLRNFLMYEEKILSKAAETEDIFFRSQQVRYENVVIATSLLSNKNKRVGIAEVAQLTCNDMFKQCGNTLGIEIRRHYFVPIILDLDHKICEKNHDCKTTKDDVEAVVRDITSRIAFFLSRAKLEYYVETRNCGVHLYISNLMVSVFCYEKLLEYLNSTGTFEYLVDDNITRLPFPHQVKCNKPVYKALGNTKWKMNHQVKLLDYQYDITYGGTTSVNELCSFKNPLETLQWDNIVETNRLEERIVRSAAPISEVKHEPAFLNRLYKRNIITKYRMFKSFFDYHHERSSNFDDVSVPDNVCDIIGNQQIFVVLSRLGQLISAQFGISSPNESSDSIRYIYTLIKPSDGPSFELYAICAMVQYIHRSISIMSYKEIFDVCMRLYESFTPVIDLTVYSKLRDHIEELIQEVCGIFSAEYIFQYIVVFNYYEIQPSIGLSNAILKVLDAEIDNHCDDATIKQKLGKIIFPFFYPCILISDAIEHPCLFNLKYYQTKTFQPGKRTISSNNNEVPLYLLNHENKFFKNANLVSRAFLDYLSTKKSINMKCAVYTYFVNTTHGVFCNLTGTYSRHVPFLTFLQRQTKLHVVYPNNEIFTVGSCVQYLNRNMSMFVQAINNIDLYWFNDIFIRSIMCEKDVLELSEYKKDFVLKLIDEKINVVDVLKLNELYKVVKERYIITNVLKNEKVEDVYEHMRILISGGSDYEIVFNENVIYEHKVLYEFDDPLMTETFRYILQLFLYNRLTILEILKQFCLLNQPLNDVRRVLLLFGSTGTGKSAFMNYVSEFHGTSVCPVMSKLTFNGGSENHSTLTLSAATSYLTIIKEAEEVDRNLIKNLSGGDAIQLREIFSLFQTVDPVAFIVCVANKFPRVIDADNAIRDRLGCFNFPCSFKKILSGKNILENYINGEAPRERCHRHLSRGLSNLFYFMYYYHVPSGRKLDTSITNTESVMLLDGFMTSNNFVHEYLVAARIFERPEASIPEKIFKMNIKRIIKDRGNKVTLAFFMSSFKVLYPNACSPDNDKISGFDFKASAKFISDNLVIIKTNDKLDIITEADVVKALEYDDKLTAADRVKDLRTFKRIYVYNRVCKSSTYIGLKLKCN